MPIAVRRIAFALDSDLRFSGDSRYRLAEGFSLWRRLRRGKFQGLLAGTIFVVQTRQPSLSRFGVGLHPLDRCLGVLTWILHQISPGGLDTEVTASDRSKHCD